MVIRGVDSSFQQNHSEYQANLDLVRSTYNELSRINEEAKAFVEGSKEFNDCETKSEAILQKFENRLRAIVGLDKLEATLKRLDFLDRKPWDDPMIVKKSDMLARQTASKFNWIKNVSDLSQITWKNVEVFESLDGFQSDLRCSKNEKLIKTTVDLFDKFKKRIDAYKPTLCQKIWQIITLRFTFIKVNQIRQCLEDLDVSYVTEAIKK